MGEEEVPRRRGPRQDARHRRASAGSARRWRPRARAFGMTIVAHDPFIAEQVAAGLGVELLSLDELCARADYITLHLPSTAETRHLFNAERLARCKTGVRIVNTARGELIDEAALADAIERGHVGGAGLDVFEKEPPADGRLRSCRRSSRRRTSPRRRTRRRSSSASRRPAASATSCATASIRNAVNFPSVRGRGVRSGCSPFLSSPSALGTLRRADERRGAHAAIGVRYYGELAERARDDPDRRARSLVGALPADPVVRRHARQRARRRRATAASRSSNPAARGRATTRA